MLSRGVCKRKTANNEKRSGGKAEAKEAEPRTGSMNNTEIKARP